MKDKLTMVMILDGFGENSNKDGNAVELANTPNIDRLMKIWPTTDIHASELSVGLPEGQMGNSEVGHTNIGAGRIVYQELTKITKSIEDGDFFTIPELVEAIENCKKNNSKLHILGLVSDGGVHSHIRHLFAILELAKRKDFENVYVHCFTDGRDTAPTSGESYIAQLEEKMKEKGVGKIATISGRFYAMDRDKRWNRIQKAYDAMVNGNGIKATSAIAAVESSYQKEVFDEFIEPTVICNGDTPVATIEDNDSVIFFNFRPDRAREITRTLVDPDFNEFETKKMNLDYVCFTQYDETMPNVKVAFKPERLVNTFGEYVSKQGLNQLRIAETEKYAHVTFFFNGGEEKQFEGEDRILVNSPKVATFDMQPEMSAYEVKDKLVAAIGENKYDFIVVNYANGDMVGHTGVYSAIEKAVVAIDACVRDTVEAAKANGYEVIIIADHGNADNAENADGTPNTAHSLNPVPFVYVTENKNARVEDGILADVAPSICHIMGLPQPAEMTGHDLLK